MELDSDIPIDSEAKAALQAGLASMGVPNTAVVVANDFGREIANLTMQYDYSADRIGGYVGGKTIRTTTGELVVVLNANAVNELGGRDLERLAAHEAGHVLIDQHHEDVSWDDTAALHPINWRRLSMYAASNALDEYRVERAVMALGYSVNSDASTSDFAQALMDANAEALQAELHYRQTQDVLALRDGVLRVVDRFSKQLANLIASQPFAPLGIAAFDPAARANWDALVAPVWIQHLEYYAAVPDARPARTERRSNHSFSKAVTWRWL